jgi:uncharacterized membrane protein YqjE
MRHIGGYVELAALDLARTQREITAQLVAVAVASVCVLFAVLFACLGVVAYAWDTPYRVTVIACMAGGFLVIGIGAAVYRSKLARARSPVLADVRREWLEDRVILERILAEDEE